MTFLKRGSAIGAFSSVTNFELRLQVTTATASRVNKSQPIGNVVFVKSPLFTGAL